MASRGILTSLVLLLGVASAVGSEAPYRPVALDKHPSGDLYILDASGRIFARTGSAIRPFATIPFGSRAVDILSARLNGEEFVFVCSIASGMQMQQQQQSNAGGMYGYGQITQIDSAGRWVKRWDLPVECGGIDIDPSTHVIYFANSRAPEFFTLRIDDPKSQPRSEGYIKGAHALGPLVIDSSKHVIYTADPISGNIFSYQLETHESRLLSDAMGAPQALAMSEDGTHLYVADATKHTIWTLAVSQQQKEPVAFSNQLLSQPTGVAQGANGHLWVADAELHQVIDLAPSVVSKSSGKAKRKATAHKIVKRSKSTAPPN
jgi:DNA-binding beta-propeller fold protein YncE